MSVPYTPAEMRRIILSYGMGVESTAILLRWMMEPETQPCPLSELLVITAQVGDEYEDTRRDVDQYIVPLMRAHGIRWVQIARAGASLKDGVVTLEDSSSPTRAFTEGRYKLSDEMRASGVVPAYTGTHKCALKFKAAPIERWLTENFRTNAAHAFGYNADETSRVAKSEYAIQKRDDLKRAKREAAKAAKLANAQRERMVFGFNKDEAKRAKKGKEYDTFIRQGWYPLIEWGWSRQDCIDYIRKILGVEWKKSACVFCPFLKVCGDAIDRHREHAPQVTSALHLEHMSLALNPRAALYASKSLINISRVNNAPAVMTFAAEQAEQRWSVYRVRRMYSAPGVADRAVERFGEMSKAEALAKLANVAAIAKTEVVEQAGISYVYRQTRVAKVYPAREEFYSVAPATVASKTRHGFERFNAVWEGREAPVAKRKRKAKAKA